MKNVRSKQVQLLLVGVALFGAFAVGCAETNELDPSEIRQISKKIINGSQSSLENVTEIFIYPEEFGGPAFGCSGTVISPRWVLTAKHCTEDYYEDGELIYTFDADDVEIVTPSGVRSRVEEIHEHPEELVDVALYQLTDHLNLPTTTFALYEGTVESVEGTWGRVTGYGGGPQSWGDVLLEQRNSSDRLLSYQPGPNGEVTTFGDSGGPVFIDIGHVPTIVGVHTNTFPDGEGIAEFSGYYYDWAMNLITALDEGGEPLEDRKKPRIAAYATEQIKLNDRAQVIWDEQSSPTRIWCNSGLYSCASVAHGTDSNFGADSRVLSVMGPGRVTLRNRADVWGHMVTNYPPDLQQGAEIEGDLFITLSTWPHPVRIGGLNLGINPDFEVGDKTAWFVGNQTGNVDLTPGTWASPNVQSGYKLVLSEPGTYIFHDLYLQPGSEVVTPSGDEITRIYVLGHLAPNGLIGGGGDASNTLLVVPNDDYFSIDGSIRATVVAPKASIDIKVGQTANFYARRLELHQGRTLRASTHPVHPNYWAPNADWNYGP